MTKRREAWRAAVALVLSAVAGCDDEVAAPTGSTEATPVVAPTQPTPTSAPSAEEPAPPALGPRAVPPACEPEYARPYGTVRVGTWNIRWFPDGAPHGPSERMTDLDRLACELVRADADVWALQEILLHHRGIWALDHLKAELARMTGHRFEVVTDRCERDDERQHVAILYDAHRVRLLGEDNLPWMNGAAPAGDGCGERLRPGLAARFDAYGGADFWLVSLHLDSGRTSRDIQRRSRAIDSLALGVRVLRSTDRDILFAGDFNVMGSDVDGFPSSNSAELADLDRRIDTLGLRRLRVEPGCTEYHGGHTSMLDHFVVTTAMDELRTRTANVLGVCARAECGPVDRDDPDLSRISDHCPVIVDIGGADDDP